MLPSTIVFVHAAEPFRVLSQCCCLFTSCWFLKSTLLVWSCLLSSGRDWPSLKLLSRIRCTSRWSCEISAKTWPGYHANYVNLSFWPGRCAREGSWSRSVGTCTNKLRHLFNISISSLLIDTFILWFFYPHFKMSLSRHSLHSHQPISFRLHADTFTSCHIHTHSPRYCISSVSTPFFLRSSPIDTIL